MSTRELAKDQPASFAFNAEYLERAKKVIAKYPAGRQASAVIPLLDFAQRQEGWVTKPAIEAIAKMLDMAAIRVLEVATFYTMFNLQPVGKTHIQVCTSLSCAVRGAGDVLKTCKDKLGISVGDVTADKAFSLIEVECSGACVNAPVVQVADDYYEDVAATHVPGLLDALKRGETPKAGSLIGRQTSAPEGGALTLKDIPAKQGA